MHHATNCDVSADALEMWVLKVRAMPGAVNPAVEDLASGPGARTASGRIAPLSERFGGELEASQPTQNWLRLARDEASVCSSCRECPTTQRCDRTI